MSKSDEWFGENPYGLEVGSKGELILVRTDTNSLIQVKKEVLPSNSVTKQMLQDLSK